MWTKTKDCLPLEGVIVNTLSEGGLEQKLKRQGNLWFSTDGSIYVYYTPIMWKAI